MSKTKDSGFATNVANFQAMVSKVIAMAGKYVPSNPDLALPQLKAVLLAAQKAGADINAADVARKTASNERRTDFKGLRKYGTRIVNAFNAQVKDVEAQQTLASFNKKLQGVRIGKKSSPTGMVALGADTAETKNVSAVQGSYTYLVEHFEKMCDTLASQSKYAPNEADLKLATVQQKLVSLRAANQKVIDAETDIQQARKKRNDIHFNPGVSLYAVATDVKKYVLSVFDSQSPDYKEIRKLRIKGPVKTRRRKAVA